MIAPGLEIELLAGRGQGVVGLGHLVAGCGNIENPSSYLLGLRRRGQCGWNLHGSDLYLHGLPGLVDSNWFGLRRLVQCEWNMLGRGLLGLGDPNCLGLGRIVQCGWILLGHGLPDLVYYHWWGLRRLGRCG